MTDDDPSGIDATVPHSARVWHHWLGGRDTYPVDRETGDKIREAFPEIVDIARSSRAFLSRAVRHLAGPQGINQFLDIGTGLPTAENTHEVAQRVAPDARVVYVDNDPLVLAYARALLTSTPEGETQFIDADLRDPGAIVEGAARTLDFGRPIALMMLNILGHIREYDEARAIAAELVAALPSGSHLVIADSTNVIRGPEAERAAELWNRTATADYHLRSPKELEGFFDGLELLEPGVVSCPSWRPEPTASAVGGDVDAFCAVGCKKVVGRTR